jgi:phosphatidate cytidylyltransferase
MAGELAKRVAVAAIGIPFAVFIIYIGGWPLAILLALIAGLGAIEFMRIARIKDVHPHPIVTVAGAVAFVLVAASFSYPLALVAMWWLTTALVLIAAAAVIWTRGVAGRPLASAAATVFGALLTGGTLSYAILLRSLLHSYPSPLDTPLAGLAVVAFPLAVTWLNDTFAYFGGKQFGKHKLIPQVSPGKTVEGTMFGLAGSIITTVLYARFVFSDWLGLPFGVGYAIIAGVALSAAAVIGDLAESLMKREAGVKDSGTLLPGHGGVLDRFDALYFTLPTAYFLLIAIVMRRSAG